MGLARTGFTEAWAGNTVPGREWFLVRVDY